MGVLPSQKPSALFRWKFGLSLMKSSIVDLVASVEPPSSVKEDVSPSHA